MWTLYDMILNIFYVLIIPVNKLLDFSEMLFIKEVLIS